MSGLAVCVVGEVSDFPLSATGCSTPSPAGDRRRGRMREETEFSGMGISLTSPTTLTAAGGRAELRSRLVAVRGELVERLARDKIEAGTLALLAGINAAIEACEAAAEPPADIAAT